MKIIIKIYQYNLKTSMKWPIIHLLVIINIWINNVKMNLTKINTITIIIIFAKYKIKLINKIIKTILKA